MSFATIAIPPDPVDVLKLATPAKALPKLELTRIADTQFAALDLKVGPRRERILGKAELWAIRPAVTAAIREGRLPSSTPVEPAVLKIARLRAAKAALKTITTWWLRARDIYPAGGTAMSGDGSGSDFLRFLQAKKVVGQRQEPEDDTGADPPGQVFPSGLPDHMTPAEMAAWLINLIRAKDPKAIFLLQGVQRAALKGDKTAIAILAAFQAQGEATLAEAQVSGDAMGSWLSDAINAVNKVGRQLDPGGTLMKAAQAAAGTIIPGGGLMLQAASDAADKWAQSQAPAAAPAQHAAVAVPAPAPIAIPVPASVPVPVPKPTVAPAPVPAAAVAPAPAPKAPAAPVANAAPPPAPKAPPAPAARQERPQGREEQVRANADRAEREMDDFDRRGKGRQPRQETEDDFAVPEVVIRQPPPEREKERGSWFRTGTNPLFR